MKKAAFLSVISVLLGPILHAQNDSVNYPVSLSSFEAGVSGNYVRLKWKTLCYLSFANFQIQKSLNGTTFSTINSFVADRIRCQQPLEFVDSAISNSRNVLYRINVGDIDGNFYHSRIIKVPNKQNNLEVLSVYPTVINSRATIVFTSPIDDNIKLKLIGSGGIVVKQYYYKVPNGVSSFTLDFADVPQGIYWITYVDAKRMQHTLAVIKQ